KLHSSVIISSELCHIRLSAATLVLLGSCPAVLRAQAPNGSLPGRITDSTNALIADAKVSAISSETNVRYEATTSRSGEYYLANLPPSSYRIEVEKSG